MVAPSRKSAGIELLEPAPPVTDPEVKKVVDWMTRAFGRLVPRLNEPSEVRFVVLHSEPGRPREGQLVYADGTDWNPGQGAGLYVHTGAAWTNVFSGADLEYGTWTPTVTAAAGTFTSVSAAGIYIKWGRLVWIQLVITITTNGTASSAIIATLPLAADASAVLAGKEFATSGKMVQGLVQGSSSNINSICYYDAAYPGVNGGGIILSGVYRVAS